MKNKILFSLLVFALLSFKYAPKHPTLYGYWNFRYLLVNDSIKTWEIESDSMNYDFMNLEFHKKDSSFSIFSSCFDIFGEKKFRVENNHLIFIVDTAFLWLPDAIRVGEKVKKINGETDFRKSRKNIARFYNGSRKYEFVNDSTLKIYKTKDSIFVYHKFKEEE